MAKTHSLDQLVEDVAAYIEETADFLVEAMLEGNQAPFEARITDQQRYDYLYGLLYLPDGTENREGRDLLTAKGGIDEFIRVKAWVERYRDKALRGSTRKPERVTAPVDEEEDDYGA